ncbi:MAG: hypothetical protein JOZ34_12580 [Gammaproteobacteria bacterium]|nr:hypothetical protein [Gammaproteobacteria bacterium]
MIDAHQRGAPAPVGFGQGFGGLAGLGRGAGNGSAGPGRREDRTQGAVKGGDARVEKTA